MSYKVARLAQNVLIVFFDWEIYFSFFIANKTKTQCWIVFKIHKRVINVQYFIYNITLYALYVHLIVQVFQSLIHFNFNRSALMWLNGLWYTKSNYNTLDSPTDTTMVSGNMYANRDFHRYMQIPTRM